MKTHYSEADLLETYYLEPGASMPVMMHLAQCSECAARYERLERKLRDVASCETARPETFWSRQRHLIMRGIEKRRVETKRVVRTLRIAATAAFAFFLGGAVMYQTLRVAPPPPATQVSHYHAPAPTTIKTTDDPWESSDQLSELHSVVQWESWVGNNDEDEL
jgi:hypothetical protein